MAADSPTVIKTLDRFVLSSLADANEWGNGKCNNVWHYDSKAEIENHPLPLPRGWRQDKHGSHRVLCCELDGISIHVRTEAIPWKLFVRQANGSRLQNSLRCHSQKNWHFC